MKKLFIVSTPPYTSPRHSLSAFFHDKKIALAQYGIQYQGEFDPGSQECSLFWLAVRLNICADESEKIEYREANKDLADKILATLAAENDPSRDSLWLLPGLGSHAVEYFDRELERYPEFSNREVHVAMLAQRQSNMFLENYKRYWKHFSLAWWREELFAANDYSLYASVFDAFGKHFVLPRLITYEADQDNSYIGPLLETLGLPDNFGVPFLPLPFPQSLVGVDIAHATLFFPFTFNGSVHFDRNGFLAGLRHVEIEENLPFFNPLTKADVHEITEHYESSNASLAESLGIKKLFPDETWDYPDPPEVLPTLTPEACRPFVAALDEDLRTALLRYFRDLGKPALNPEQIALAGALENYRQRFSSSSIWSFPRKEPTLSVLTMSYNHKNYIAACMESVIAQKTDFPIEHIIIDDASDDGTQEIIEDYALKYPHIRPIYMRGRGIGSNVSILFSACKSEYASLCDGDDYFTDPNKLQMQVDFLKENKDCALCFHPVHVKFENGQRNDFIFPMLGQLPRKSKQRFYLADLVQGNFIQTNSVVYRWRFREGLPEWFNPYLCPGDWYWHLLHAETGKIGFIPRVMSVYRRHSSALYSSAFIDRDKHFAEHGMHEVETINILNQHFNGRYFRHLANLADSFFTSFYKRQIDAPDCHVLDEACEKYPEFGLHFLKTLRSVQKEHPAH